MCADPQAADASPSQAEGVVYFCIVILRNPEAFLTDFLLNVGLPIHFSINFLVLACGKDTGISVSIT